MAKFAFHGFLLLIVIAIIHGKQLVKQSREVIKIKESLKNETFMDHLIHCMYNQEGVVCHSYRMRLATDLFRLAYEYDKMTHKCLTGENDPPLDEACELYQLLKNTYPQYWEKYLAAIKHSVEHKIHIRDSTPKMMKDLVHMLIDDGALAVAVTKCIVDQELCFDVVYKQIREVLVFAESACPTSPSNRKTTICRIFFAFKEYYPSLYEILGNQIIEAHYDPEKATIQFHVVKDEL